MEREPEYHIEDGKKKAARSYRALHLPPELHQQIKVLAARAGMTMIDYVAGLVAGDGGDNGQR